MTVTIDSICDTRLGAALSDVNDRAARAQWEQVRQDVRSRLARVFFNQADAVAVRYAIQMQIQEESQ